MLEGEEHGGGGRASWEVGYISTMLQMEIIVE
jgi:hypothetical protein